MLHPAWMTAQYGPLNLATDTLALYTPFHAKDEQGRPDVLKNAALTGIGTGVSEGLLYAGEARVHGLTNRGRAAVQRLLGAHAPPTLQPLLVPTPWRKDIGNAVLGPSLTSAIMTALVAQRLRNKTLAQELGPPVLLPVDRSQELVALQQRLAEQYTDGYDLRPLAVSSGDAVLEDPRLGQARAAARRSVPLGIRLGLPGDAY